MALARLARTFGSELGPHDQDPVASLLQGCAHQLLPIRLLLQPPTFSPRLLVTAGQMIERNVFVAPIKDLTRRSRSSRGSTAISLNLPSCTAHLSTKTSGKIRTDGHLQGRSNGARNPQRQSLPVPQAGPEQATRKPPVFPCSKTRLNYGYWLAQ